MNHPHKQKVDFPPTAEILRQPHIGPQTYIGVMFADLRAKWCKMPTSCAF